MKQTALALTLLLAACVPAAPTEAPAPTPTLRIVMIATDPATVELAAGRPQFVEFFAFW